MSEYQILAVIAAFGFLYSLVASRLERTPINGAFVYLEISLNHALNRLGVLLGQDAGSLQAEFSAIEGLPVPVKSLGTGVPGDVLRQRPDIRRAERLLAAQTAQIGVATADLYPRFGLGGFFGFQSTSLSNLLESSSVTWGLSSPIQWNIFNGGRVRSNIQVQDEKAQQRLLHYEQKVLSAVEEVENAIVAFNLGQLRQQHLKDAAEATMQAEELVLVQYNTGLTDFNNVLVTQRDLSSQQDQLVIAQAQILVDLIALYKALGGGWNIDQPIELSYLGSEQKLSRIGATKGRIQISRPPVFCRFEKMGPAPLLGKMCSILPTG